MEHFEIKINKGRTTQIEVSWSNSALYGLVVKSLKIVTFHFWSIYLIFPPRISKCVAFSLFSFYPRCHLSVSHPSIFILDIGIRLRSSSFFSFRGRAIYFLVSLHVTTEMIFQSSAVLFPRGTQTKSLVYCWDGSFSVDWDISLVLWSSKRSSTLPSFAFSFWERI